MITDKNKITLVRIGVSRIEFEPGTASNAGNVTDPVPGELRNWDGLNGNAFIGVADSLFSSALVIVSVQPWIKYI